MGVDLDKWIEKVRKTEYLAEDELKALCDYVSSGFFHWWESFNGSFPSRSTVTGSTFCQTAWSCCIIGDETIWAQIKEILVEESNVQPVNSPVTVPSSQPVQRRQWHAVEHCLWTELWLGPWNLAEASHTVTLCYSEKELLPVSIVLCIEGGNVLWMTAIAHLNDAVHWRCVAISMVNTRICSNCCKLEARSLAQITSSWGISWTGATIA